MRWTSYRSETCSGALTLHSISCTLKRWHAASTKGSKTRPERACIPGPEALFSLAFWPTRSGPGWMWRRGAPRGAHQVHAAVLACPSSPGLPTAWPQPIRCRVSRSPMRCSRRWHPSAWITRTTAVFPSGGGISAGLAARAPEPILFLQSGHGSHCAARNYMVPRDPHLLYETYLAFGLQL